MFQIFNHSMDKNENVNKIYCEKCDSIFESRSSYDKHFEKHSSAVSCESCPLDMAIQKLVNLFRRIK